MAQWSLPAPDIPTSNLVLLIVTLIEINMSKAGLGKIPIYKVHVRALQLREMKTSYWPNWKTSLAITPSLTVSIVWNFINATAYHLDGNDAFMSYY